MDLNIKGDPGTGNHYEEVRVEHVDSYAPHARIVERRYETTVNLVFRLSISINGRSVMRSFRTIFRLFSLSADKCR